MGDARNTKKAILKDRFFDVRLYIVDIDVHLYCRA